MGSTGGLWKGQGHLSPREALGVLWGCAVKDRGFPGSRGAVQVTPKGCTAVE